MLDTEEARRARYREIVQSLTLMDDIFMTAVFQDSLPCVDLVLQIILDRPNLRATRVVTQDTLKNLHGHDLRLDIHAFADGQEFNIEIQRAKKGAEPRRARYHSSMMDANALPEGADYVKLPESYVIFITETDVLGMGQPLYVIERVIRGGGGHFDDGTHIIYVNASMADTTTPLGRLMHDFRCVRSEEMYYEVLAKQAGAFKNTEKGVIHMSSKWEQFVEEITAEAMESGMKEGMERGMEQGMARGEEKAYLSSIRRMMEKLSVTAEKAMDVLAIPQSEWGRYKAML
ncbi:MAG: PD-(D/E)XK nuclease family transposase [Selenomonas massiliensis]